MMVKPRCFHCMEPLNAPDEQCPHCKYHNQNRTNEAGMLSDVSLKRQYQVGRALGRGSYGITYLGYDRYLERRVLIKEFVPGNMAVRSRDGITMEALPGYEEKYKKACKRALLEAQMARGMGQVPGFAQVYDAMRLNNTVYIIMEPVVGETLTDYVKKRPQHLSLAEAVALLDDVAQGLSRIHKRDLVHRAVKPGNVFISKATGKAMLTDFGANRLEDDPSVNPVAEDSRAQRNAFSDFAPDVRIDQLGLAETLYFTLTGKAPPALAERIAQKSKPPFIRPVNQKVPISGEDAVRKAMALNADDRYASVEEFWAALTATVNRGVKKPVRQENDEDLSQNKKLCGCSVIFFFGLVLLYTLAFLSNQGSGTGSDAGKGSSTVQATQTPAVPYESAMPKYPVPMPDPDEVLAIIEAAPEATEAPAEAEPASAPAASPAADKDVPEAIDALAAAKASPEATEAPAEAVPDPTPTPRLIALPARATATPEPTAAPSEDAAAPAAEDALLQKFYDQVFQ